MFTIRNLGGVALFLFGTTYLWLTPMFASRGVSTRGLAWSITNVMAFATIVGFTIATVGLFRKATWWESAAIASAIVGLIVLSGSACSWSRKNIIHGLIKLDLTELTACYENANPPVRPRQL